MKRSAAVPLTIVMTLSAGAIAGCAPSAEPLQCVDKTSQRAVPDSLCVRAGVSPGDATTAGPAGSEAGAVHRGGFPVGGLFAWYYGGRIVRGLVSGGSYAPLAGRAYRSPSGLVAGAARGRGGAFGANRGASPSRSGRSGVSRGGFGATGAGRFGGG